MLDYFSSVVEYQDSLVAECQEQAEYRHAGIQLLRFEVTLGQNSLVVQAHSH